MIEELLSSGGVRNRINGAAIDAAHTAMDSKDEAAQPTPEVSNTRPCRLVIVIVQVDLTKLIFRWNTCLQALARAISLQVTEAESAGKAPAQRLVQHPEDLYASELHNHQQHLAHARQLTADLVERTGVVKRIVPVLRESVAHASQQYDNEKAMQARPKASPTADVLCTPIRGIPTRTLSLEPPTPSPYAVPIPTDPVTPFSQKTPIQTPGAKTRAAGLQRVQNSVRKEAMKQWQEKENASAAMFASPAALSARRTTAKALTTVDPRSLSTPNSNSCNTPVMSMAQKAGSRPNERTAERIVAHVQESSASGRQSGKAAVESPTILEFDRVMNAVADDIVSVHSLLADDTV